MKKYLLSLFLIAIISGSVFAKGNIAPLNKNCVYAVYKIEIRNDINRDFYSKTLGYPELVDNPHTSGYHGKEVTEKPFFKDSGLEIMYYEGQNAGSVSVIQIAKDKDKGIAALSGIHLYLFGSKYSVLLPVAANQKERDSGHKLEYNTVAYDSSAKYVYLGTFVYDFVDGTIYPSLVGIIDEYDEAVEWLKEETGKDVLMCRGTIE